MELLNMFKVGDRVECIEQSLNNNLQIGKIYTIDIMSYTDQVLLEEIPYMFFYAERFKLAEKEYMFKVGDKVCWRDLAMKFPRIITDIRDGDLICLNENRELYYNVKLFKLYEEPIKVGDIVKRKGFDYDLIVKEIIGEKTELELVAKLVADLSDLIKVQTDV